MAWTRGSLALASWIAVAPGLGLTLLVPRAARTETLLARPAEANLLDVLLVEPSVLVTDSPGRGYLAEIENLYDREGLFDPLALWVVAMCRDRGWAALSSDPGRLRRIDPTVEITQI